MANSKPFVAAACVCEKVLQEKDDVASLMRIVDTFTLQAVNLPPGFEPMVSLTVFVSVKSGDVTGQHEIGLVLRSPDGKRHDVRKWPVVLNGGEHGAHLVLNFNLTKPKMGLYWFDVVWGEDNLTSIPFRLKQAEPTDQEPTTV